MGVETDGFSLVSESSGYKSSLRVPRYSLWPPVSFNGLAFELLLLHPDLSACASKATCIGEDPTSGFHMPIEFVDI